EEFQRWAEDEFPHRSTEWLRSPDRREALRLMAASLALAGLTGCTVQPQEQIVPYVRQPEQLVPGRPLFFATAMPMCGYGSGLLVESHEARPTKVEGNPAHPGSLGATDAFAQASVLTLYDPDRSRAVVFHNRITSWPRFLTVAAGIRERHSATGGAGLRFLLGATSSPTLAEEIRELQAIYPKAQWHFYEPVGGTGAGSAAVFGRPLHPIFDLTLADVILSLDADFLACGPGCLVYARQFADRRRVTGDIRNMNRLYVAEPAITSTGSVADHRLPIRAVDVEPLARALAAEVGAAVEEAPGKLSETQRAWVKAAAADLRRARGHSVVIAGEGQPPAVHALAHVMNEALGNAGRTVRYTEPVVLGTEDYMGSLGALTAAMRQGQVDTLVIAGTNPVYTAPADLEFAEAMARVPTRIHLGLYRDETAELCQWHIPEAHFLESWGDVRAYDGTVSIIQPLIEPLYDGRSIYEFLAAFTSAPDRRGYDMIRAYWRRQSGAADFETFWRTALHNGIVPNTQASPVAAAANAAAIPPSAPPAEAPATNVEIVFRPDPTVWDGRFANNGWLQELPKPVSKLTWDNAALISPATAKALGVKDEDVVELSYRGRAVRAPVLVMPGHADNSVTVHLGYGRKGGGSVALGRGFDAYRLRTFDRPWFGEGVEIRKLGEKYSLARTQGHYEMGRRDLVRSATLPEVLKNSGAGHEGHHPALSLYPGYAYLGYAWGMVIDQGICTGCSACVVACQAENNIPVVGKGQVLRSREMHWLRIDVYYRGAPEKPDVYHQPMLCQHCEMAPCEPVCPVAATVHSADGLNQMVYNRCVGTRYCSNNCPYKVRRFNFFLYADWYTPSLYAMRNPNVTVRSRGVMEKCTFCIQRIESAKIQAAKTNRRVEEGEVVTACQAACPTRAIHFGDLNNPRSAVAQMRGHPLGYQVLAELDTRPRISYLEVVRNPNPEMRQA
ncbi:MAG: 4Fe-4S dicluster domain-containing protein, partial [Bryobacteraceae bacterium]|nr:4Fe-4S dicluster domain-containing protein [Bryobacteraceae bacterium]